MTNAQLLSMTHTILSVFLLGFFFAKLEIAIEGDAGWAENLPTWRIEGHWLLDIFWGGRVMTGYHAWAFPSSLYFFIFHWCLVAIILGKPRSAH